MNTMKIGWYEESITPDKRISMSGQFYERISNSVETPITATAFALECGGDSMIICSCDLTTILAGFQDKVRERLAGRIDIPLEKIMICATHTHASHLYQAPNPSKRPGTLAVLQRVIPKDMLYVPLVTLDDTIMTKDESLEFLVDRISTCIIKAWEARKPGIYAPGFGRAAVGMCRRACYDDGTALMWGETNTANFTKLEAGNDNGIEMLFIFDEDKKPTGVILNIACPSQVLEHRNVISSDYWGKVKMFLRERFGEDFYVLGLCSAAGDQCPRDLIRWQDGETPIHDPNISRAYPVERRSDGSMFDIQGTVRIGRRISSEVLAAFDEINSYVSETEFCHVTKILDLPLRRVTKEEYNNAKAAIDKFVEKNQGKPFDYNDTAAMYVHAGTICRYDEQQEIDTIDVEAHFIRLGDMAIATNPFELFLDYGNQIRARSLAKQTFLIQLCCDSRGYLPTKDAEAGGHYSAFVSSGRTGHEGGELLVRHTLAAINGFFKSEDK